MKTQSQPWQQQMKKLKLQHIKRTAPGFYDLSGGDTMTVKPYSETSDTKLANAIAACLKYCGGTSEVQYNFSLVKGRDGFKPDYEDYWKPIRVNASLQGKKLVIEVNRRAKPAAKSEPCTLHLRTCDFETFSRWVCLHFPASTWTQMIQTEPVAAVQNSS